MLNNGFKVSRSGQEQSGRLRYMWQLPSLRASSAFAPVFWSMSIQYELG